MLKYKKKIVFFILALLAVTSEAFFIRSFSPDQNVSLFHLQIPSQVIFFILFFLFVFCLMSVFVNKKQGILLGIFLSIYLYFRSAGLTKLLYQVLLLLIFISIELFLFQKKKEKE